jgi:DmsE family decaheme c-type cytochrome
MRGLRAGLILGSAALMTFLLGSGVRAATPSATPQDSAVDVNECKACHDETVTRMQGTPHLGIENECATCHGDTAGHVASITENSDKGPIRSFKALKAADINATCLSCHESGHAANWAGSVHDRRGLACTSCHSVHDFKSPAKQLKTVRDAETCFGCHTQIRAKSMRVSHHPVREGLMTCSSCHDPHDGSKEKLVSADSVNEKCLTCHMEKRGPFLWEHAPVRENCTLCHDAHGSNHEKLLVAKQPYLCQRCHLNTRHPGTLYDGSNSLAGTSASNRLVEHSCRNCHQNIHGGNAPSGPYLGR